MSATTPRSPQDFPMDPRSRYAGRPADASRRRSIVLVGETTGEHDWPAGREAVIDFVYHAGQFWRAVVPLDGVGEVMGQAFNFSPPRTRQGKSGREIVYDQHGVPRPAVRHLNHVQTRFRMRSDCPLRLYPLDSEPTGEPVAELGDIVYSIEAIAPVGVLFNLRDAVAGHLLCAHRMLSMEEMVFERVVVENQYVLESPPLPIDDETKRALLVASLRRSHRAGMQERYFMYRPCRTNNCTSTPFELLDKVVRYRWRHRLGAFLYRLPLNPRLYLRLRGLDANPRVRKLVRDEFAAFIADSATQKRKRAFVKQQIAARRAARSVQ